MRTVRVGLIGAGFIGAVHARALSALPDSKLVAVADLDEARARALAEPLGAAAYGDYREMCAREDLDAVIVATSDSAHRDPCVAAARAGAHLLVEKPLATTLQDCDSIAAEAEKQGVNVLVGHTLRWEPRYALAKEAIGRGDLGEVSYIYARRCNAITVARRVGTSTSVARFLAVHDIDWIHWALGERPCGVFARSACRVLSDLGTPDVYCILMRFRSGALACVEAAWILPEAGSRQLDFQLEALGSNASLVISVNDQGLSVNGARGLQFADVVYFPVVRGEPQGVYVEEMRHFLDVARGEAKPLCNVEEARAAVAVVLAVEQSAQSGEEVQLDWGQ
jgi:predicted dehydrogenase